MQYLIYRRFSSIIPLFLLFLSIELIGQENKLIINDIIYIQDIKSGSDITDQLANAIEASNNGDIIVLPEGQFYLSSKIRLIDKMISIIGRGCTDYAGTTLLRDSQHDDESMFYIAATMPEEEQYLTLLAGVYIKSIPSYRYSGEEKVMLQDRCVFFENTTRFILTDNVFQYFGESGITVRHEDSIIGYNGLIFNNKFLDIYRPELANLGYGIQVAGHEMRWITDPEFGSNKFLFIEDNYFRENRHSVAAGSNGKYIFRMNTVEDNWAGGAVDMHGAGEFGNAFSTRASEIYGNVFSSKFDKYGDPISAETGWSDFPQSAALVRGGESLIFDNVVSNYQYVVKFNLEESSPSSYPSQYQIGYRSGFYFGIDHFGVEDGKDDGDVFFWNNEFEQKYPQWKEYVISSVGVDSLYIKVGRDIHVDVDKKAYTPYTYPHNSRKLYYQVIDTLLSQISITNIEKLSDHSIQLTWQNVIGEDGYYIHLSTDGANYNIIDSTEINVTTILIDSLNAENYWFVVSAYNDHYQGNKSVPLKLNSDLNKAAHFRIYPNPSNGAINIQAIDLLLGSDFDVIDIYVWTVTGTMVLRESIQAINNEVYEMSIPKGLKGSLLISVRFGSFRQNEILSIY